MLQKAVPRALRRVFWRSFDSFHHLSHLRLDSWGVWHSVGTGLVAVDPPRSALKAGNHECIQG